MIADVVIIGGGIVGAAIFHAVTQHLPLRAVLIERDRFGSGSTGRSGGIVRVYHPDATLADLAAEGLAYYRRFTDEVGSSCGYRQTGFVYLEDAAHEDAVRGEATRLHTTFGLAIDVVDRQALRARFPAADWDDVTCAVYEPYGGYIDPVATARAWVDAGRRLGGVAMEGIAAQKIIVRDRRVASVDTTQGSIPCAVAIIAAGAWSRGIADQLGIAIDIRSKRIAAHAFHDVAPEAALPAFVDERTGLYGRPIGGRAMLMGLPVDAWDVPLDDGDIGDPESVNAVQDLAEQRFPQIAGTRPWGGRYSFDGYTPEGRGRLAFLPEIAGALLAAGWSGGGAKAAPAIARRVVSMLGERLS